MLWDQSPTPRKTLLPPTQKITIKSGSTKTAPQQVQGSELIPLGDNLLGFPHHIPLRGSHEPLLQPLPIARNAPRGVTYVHDAVLLGVEEEPVIK